MQCEMSVMDLSGHTEVHWDPENDEETRTAREMFDAMRAKGYQAFRIGLMGGKGRRIDAFDPQAEKMILIPHMAGG